MRGIVGVLCVLAAMGGLARAEGRLYVAAPYRPVRVIYWTAGYCLPCRQVRPAVDRLVRAGWPIEVHDIEQEARTAELWGIVAIPCIQVVGQDGRERGRMTPPLQPERIETFLSDAGVVRGPAVASDEPKGTEDGKRTVRLLFAR